MATRLEHQLHEWHNKVYGPDVDLPATFRHLCEEVGELGEAIMRIEMCHPGEEEKKKERVTKACLEAADVAILTLMCVRGIEGESASLSSWMAVKLDIIQQRLDSQEVVPQSQGIPHER